MKGCRTLNIERWKNLRINFITQLESVKTAINDLHKRNTVSILILLAYPCNIWASSSQATIDITNHPSGIISDRTDDQTILMGADDWPPWVIHGPNASSSDPDVAGIDIEIAKALSTKLALKIKFVRCPWARCLTLLKAGKLDIVGSIFQTEERKSFAHFIEPAYVNMRSNVFYTIQSKSDLITRYEDLHKKIAVGTVRDASYFDQFDNDTAINKYALSDDHQLLWMLKRGRLDVVIGEEVVYDYYISQLNLWRDLSKSKYRYNETRESFFALSRKSIFAKDLAKFNKALSDLIHSGEVNQIINKMTNH